MSNQINVKSDIRACTIKQPNVAANTDPQNQYQQQQKEKKNLCCYQACAGGSQRK